MTFLVQSAILKILERATTAGALRLVMPDGRERCFIGREEGPSAEISIHDWRLVRAVSQRSDCGLGEAYMMGWWDSPDIEAFMAWTIRNMGGFGKLAWGSRLYQLKSRLRDRFLRRNTVSGSRRNILAHYDLGNDFYRLWLDPSMSYSSAIYRERSVSLLDAQRAKYGRILGRLEDRDRVLEVGCGWGGFMAEASAEGRKVTGLTISEQQFDYVRQRAAAGSEVRLQDYRASDGKYPALVSIEMFEAVGEAYWPRYFRMLRDRLTNDGIAVIQTIAIREQLFQSYRNCTDFIREHIFPGGMLPTVPRIIREADEAGLAVRDVYNFGPDYARTLRDWLERFDAAEPQIAELGYDRSFRRGWRLYLAMCAAAFADGRIDVHQIELRPQS